MINYYLAFVSKKLRDVKGEFGVSVIINIAIALIITAFIFVPNLKTLATTMTSDITSWYNTTIKTVLFQGTT